MAYLSVARPCPRDNATSSAVERNDRIHVPMGIGIVDSNCEFVYYAKGNGIRSDLPNRPKDYELLASLNTPSYYNEIKRFLGRLEAFCNYHNRCNNRWNCGG